MFGWDLWRWKLEEVLLGYEMTWLRVDYTYGLNAFYGSLEYSNNILLVFESVSNPKVVFLIGILQLH